MCPICLVRRPFEDGQGKCLGSCLVSRRSDHLKGYIRLVGSRSIVVHRVSVVTLVLTFRMGRGAQVCGLEPKDCTMQNSRRRSRTASRGVGPWGSI